MHGVVRRGRNVGLKALRTGRREAPAEFFIFVVKDSVSYTSLVASLQIPPNTVKGFCARAKSFIAVVELQTSAAPMRRKLLPNARTSAHHNRERCR